MPAPDLPTLFDFETHIEDALVVFFKARYAAWQVLTARTSPADEKKNRTPRMEIRVQVAGTGAQQNQRPSDGAWYQSHKLGALTLRVIAARGKDGQSLGQMRGAVRAAMLELTQALNETNLPWYQIGSVVESSGTPAIFSDNDEIITELGFAIEWWIRPDAFPLS